MSMNIYEYFIFRRFLSAYNSETIGFLFFRLNLLFICSIGLFLIEEKKKYMNNINKPPTTIKFKKKMCIKYVKSFHRIYERANIFIS